MALREVVRALALAAVGGPWKQKEILRRAAPVVGLGVEALSTQEEHAPLRKVLRGLTRLSKTPLPLDQVEQRIWGRLVQSPPDRPRTFYFLCQPWLGTEPVRAGRFPIPAIADLRELADRLRMSPGDLMWLADWTGQTPNHPRDALRHYHHRWIEKRNGRGWRLLEVPKERLKQAQRRLLDQVVSDIPVHAAACGFVPGRSVLDHAGAHVAAHTVITLDLQSWFWHIGFERIYGLLITAGLPREVSRVVAGLAVTVTPHRVVKARPDSAELPLHRRFDPGLLRQAHLPQGAPTSPAFANAVAWRMDTRLTALAESAGATYSRYADDLAFSGGASWGKDAPRFLALVRTIVEEEGFRVHPHKSRVQRQGNAQRVCGIVVNEHRAVRRAERDRLEAMIVNARRHGLDRLRLEGHDDPLAYLEGRVAWVAQVNPAHARRLAQRLQELRRAHVH